MSIKLRHVGIVSSDIDESVKFYRDVLGFNVYLDQHESGEYLDTFLSTNGVDVRTIKMKNSFDDVIELLHFTSPSHVSTDLEFNVVGCSHIAITVDDVDALYQRILDKNIPHYNEPTHAENSSVKVFFFKDPSGFIIEAVQE